MTTYPYSRTARTSYPRQHSTEVASLASYTVPEGRVNDTLETGRSSLALNARYPVQALQIPLPTHARKQRISPSSRVVANDFTSDYSLRKYTD